MQQLWRLSSSKYASKGDVAEQAMGPDFSLRDSFPAQPGEVSLFFKGLIGTILHLNMPCICGKRGSTTTNQDMLVYNTKLGTAT